VIDEMKKILFVSDELELVDSFPQGQWDIVSVSTLAEAEKKAESDVFDCLLTELVIDGKSGLDLIKKARVKNPQIRTLILAKQATLHSALQSIQLRVDAYLVRPFKAKQVMEKIQELCSLKEKTEGFSAGKTDPMMHSLLEITRILYQVNDFELACEMILDTYNEFFKYEKVGLAFPIEERDRFVFLKSRNLNEEFIESFTFNPDNPIQGKKISKEKITRIHVKEQVQIKIENSAVIVDDISAICFYPLRFHEELIGFVVLFTPEDQPELSTYLDVMSTQIAPVLYSFDMVKKDGNSYENIISKIIRDRVHEARLMLNPISFAVFRIVYQDQFVDSLRLEDAIRIYQNIFRETFQDETDLIWLSVDTIFAIFPFKDLFMAESKANQLKEKIERIYIHEEGKSSFSLKYACISYPQSGESSTDIINNLWLKLFEEIYFMQS